MARVLLADLDSRFSTFTPICAETRVEGRTAVEYVYCQNTLSDQKYPDTYTKQ
jgi:hypothetical protein